MTPARWVAVVAWAVLAAGCSSDATRGPAGHLVDDEPVEGVGRRFTRIRYRSLDADGRSIDVTGLVAVPAGPAPDGGWPVVAFAPGTTGIAPRCAPSADPSYVRLGVVLGGLADAGYVAVATDYEGVGTGGPHPYLDGDSEARSVVDSVCAAALVDGAGTRWVVAGHSRGGHAALFTAEQADDLAPELELLGAAAIAPVADPVALTGPMATSDSPFLLLMAAGFVAGHGDADDHLTDAAAAAVDALEDDCTIDPVPGGVLRGEWDDFGQYQARNRVGGEATDVPVLVQQGGADVLVTPSETLRAVERLCGAYAAPVELRVYDGADHLTILDTAHDDLVAWIGERFAGRLPAVDTCAV